MKKSPAKKAKNNVPLLFYMLIFIMGCQNASEQPRPFDIEQEQAAIAEVLNIQESAWNNGDINVFMTTYWKSDSLRFASGGTIRYGWDETMERYLTTYPDKDAMGQLTFTLHDIQLLSSSNAMVFGGYALKRTQELGDLNGLFTLILKKLDGQWIIVHDHTSAGN